MVRFWLVGRRVDRGRGGVVRGQGQMVAALVYAVWYWEGRGCGCVRISWVVGMFRVRARNRKAVTVGGKALVRGEGVVVTSWVELCML